MRDAGLHQLSDTHDRLDRFDLDTEQNRRVPPICILPPRGGRRLVAQPEPVCATPAAAADRTIVGKIDRVLDSLLHHDFGHQRATHAEIEEATYLVRLARV